MADHKNLVKKKFLIFSFILINFSTGCGKTLIRSENVEEHKNEEKINMFLERHQKAAVELNIIKEKLDEVTGQIYVFTTKGKYGSKMINEPMEKSDKNKASLDTAKIEAKDLQKKYDVLSIELKEIEQNLKNLGYPIEKLLPQPKVNVIPASSK